jgi:hypothetical protein
MLNKDYKYESKEELEEMFKDTTNRIMKAKLHKMESGYILSLNGDIDDPYAIVNKELAEDYEWYKLSKQNCDEIFGVVDVEKLAEEFLEKHKFASSHIADITSFKYGFNKAMELNKDKVFTLEDIKIAIQFGWDDEAMIAKEISDKYGFNASEYHSKNIIPFIQSIQQPTEIEVEIEMEPHYDGEFIDDSKTHIVEPKWRPALDADGCLILKRI